jgi:2,3-bisphosphoglycerate-independent phosphoglycerate mutase
METVAVPRLTHDDRYAEWADRAAAALDDYQALYVHLKGPDVPAHDGKAEDKKKIIETIDRAFFGEVLPRLNMRDTVVAVTADHSTSCVREAHTAEPVPLLVSGAGVSPDGTVSFGEREAATGSLGLLAGTEIVPTLVELMRN